MRSLRYSYKLNGNRYTDGTSSLLRHILLQIYLDFEGERYIFEEQQSYGNPFLRWNILRVLLRCPCGFDYVIELNRQPCGFDCIIHDQANASNVLVFKRINLRAHANKIIRDELQKNIAKKQEEIAGLQAQIELIMPKNPDSGRRGSGR